MTPEEMIKQLEMLKAEIEWEHSLEYQLVLENVIGIVGKEIEKPVIKNLVTKDDLCSMIQYIGSIKSIQCPMCNRTLKHSKGKLTGRCPNCGQKLDWR